MTFQSGIDAGIADEALAVDVVDLCDLEHEGDGSCGVNDDGHPFSDSGSGTSTKLYNQD